MLRAHLDEAKNKKERIEQSKSGSKMVMSTHDSSLALIRKELRSQQGNSQPENAHVYFIDLDETFRFRKNRIVVRVFVCCDTGGTLRVMRK